MPFQKTIAVIGIESVDGQKSEVLKEIDKIVKFN
jgi:hypothetical protein